MAVVLMKKVTALLTGEAEEVVIGASGRVIEAVLYDFDGNVQDITGWSAQIVGTSDDLPGVSIDVAGEIVSPASGGTFRWTRVGDFLTQIGEKSSARFRCQVKWTDADGLVDYSHAFQITFVVDGTGEDTNMNAAAVQALIDARVGHPFEFPLSGTMKTGTPIVGPTISNGQSYTVFSATGEGIVRNLAWICTAVLADAVTPTIPNLTVEIRVDGESTPSVSVPIHTLGGLEHPSIALEDLNVSTPAFELTSGVFSSAFPGEKLGQSGNWRLPIPYSNGIDIRFVAGAGTTRNVIYCNVMYQDTLPECWNRGFRIYGTRSNETLAAATSGPSNAKLTSNTQLVATTGSFVSTIAGKSIIAEGACYSDMLVLSRTDSTHIVVSAKDTVGSVPVLDTNVSTTICPSHKFLERAAGESGYIAAIVGGARQMDGDSDLLFEGNVRMFLNQEADPTLVWSSVEDFGMGSFYYAQPNQNEEGGITAKANDGTGWAIYKVFYNQPVKYTNGIKATVPQYSIVGSTTFNWTTFGYRITG